MKQGYGLPQMFAILLVLVAGAAYITVAFIQAGISEPVTKETNKMDFGDVQAHYYLAGILRTPMNNPPASLREVQLEPTLGDFLVHTQRAAFTEKDSWDDFETEVHARLEHTGAKHALFFGNRGYARSFTRMSHTQSAWNDFPCPSGTAEIVLPGGVVRLQIC